MPAATQARIMPPTALRVAQKQAAESTLSPATTVKMPTVPTLGSKGISKTLPRAAPIKSQK